MTSWKFATACLHGLAISAAIGCTRTLYTNGDRTAQPISTSAVHETSAPNRVGSAGFHSLVAPPDVDAAPASTKLASVASNVIDSGLLHDAGADDDAGSEARESANGCPAAGCPDIEAISLGDYLSCVLLRDHRVMCWGENTLGENDSTIAPKSQFPTLVPGLTDVRVFRAGRTHSCFVTLSGQTKCYGMNQDGQLGDGTQNTSVTPVNVPLDYAPVALALGDSHACALGSEGELQCWGSDSAFIQPSVTHIPTAISARGRSTCALFSDGKVNCGRAAEFDVVASPPSQQDIAIDGVTSVADGGEHFCALLSDGTVACWGRNFDGELGNPTQVADQNVPSAVSGLHDVGAIALGLYSSCALLQDHTVACWGFNNNGQVGDGTMLDSDHPVTVIGLDDVRLLAAGLYHYCAVKSDNSVLCWGMGNDYQLGNGRARSSNVPVVVRFDRE